MTVCRSIPYPLIQSDFPVYTGFAIHAHTQPQIVQINVSCAHYFCLYALIQMTLFSGSGSADSSTKASLQYSQSALGFGCFVFEYLSVLLARFISPDKNWCGGSSSSQERWI